MTHDHDQQSRRIDEQKDNPLLQKESYLDIGGGLRPESEETDDPDTDPTPESDPDNGSENSDDDAFPFAEDTPLTWALGDHSKTLIISALLGAAPHDINKADLGGKAGISRPAVYEPLKELQGILLVQETRTIGQSTMYQLDPDQGPVRTIAKLEQELLEGFYEQEDVTIDGAGLESDASEAETADREPTAIDKTEEAYAEDTPLTWVFGTHPKVKLVATLLSEIRRDMNITDIARLSGLSRSTVYNHLGDLVELNLVIKTRTIGPSDMYQLNTDWEAVRLLAKLEEELLDELHTNDEFDPSSSV